MGSSQLSIAHIGWVASCHLVRRVDELCRRGVRGVVFTDNVPEHFDPDAHAFTVELLPKDLFPTPLKLVAWLEERLAALDIDVLHAHSTHFPASLAYFVRNTPVICSPWDFVYSRDPYSPAFHRAILDELSTGRLMDAVSFSSKPYMEEIVNGGLPRKRAFWHSWGVELSTFQPGKHARRADEIRQELGLEPDDIMLLSPRTPSLPANADIAMQAVARLQGKHKVKLVVTGHHITRESLYYERLSARPEVAGSMRFIPTVRGDQDIAALYEASDIVLSIHNNDFNPATVLESFAMERPVLVHDLKTVAFWAEHGVNGWHVPARDVDTTVAMLDEILSMDRAIWRDMGRSGRASVVAHADFQKTMDSLPDHYRQIMKLAGETPRRPLTAYDKGLLVDICNDPGMASIYYEQALLSGEERPRILELLEEKRALISPDKGLGYFTMKRSQPVVRAMVSQGEQKWDSLSLRLPVPMSLFRHDFIAGLWPLLETDDTAGYLHIIDYLADHYQTDVLEWIGETIMVFGHRFGQWEACAKVLLSSDVGGCAMARAACDVVQHLGTDHVLARQLLTQSSGWLRCEDATLHPHLADQYDALQSTLEQLGSCHVN